MNISADERLDDIGRGMKVIQSSSTPCFSIDAVLLADFASENSPHHVVDLGTGTGIIPLLLSRRLPEARFTALELMPVMAAQAARSIALNGLENRIRVVEGDIKNADSLLGRECADLVVANPPYYKVGHGRMNRDPVFAAARQEVSCTLADVIVSASALLKSYGRFAMVIRAERVAEAIGYLIKCGLNPGRFRAVQPYCDKPANLALLEAVKGGKSGLVIMPPLVVYDSPGCYSKEITEIYDR